MTTDFRALCVELTDCLEKADWPSRYRHVFRQWVDIARAALADEPAVPEGREPVAVAGQPSDEELLKLTEDWPATTGPRHDLSGCPEVPLYSVFADEVVEFARAVLDRWGHQPAPPAEGEAAELAAKLRRLAPHNPLGTADPTITRAADLLQRLSPPQPVLVSKRRPGPKDCLDEGWAWFFSPRVGWRQAVLPVSPAFTHWLPAHALPIPQQQETVND